MTTKATTVSYYAPTIGLVKSESTEDVESRINGNTTTQHRTATTVLASYHVTTPAWEMAAIGFVGASPPGDSPVPAVADTPPPSPPPTPPTKIVAVADPPHATPPAASAKVSLAPTPVIAGEPGLPHPIGMADLSSTSYVSLVSRYGYFDLGNIGTGAATAIAILIEVKADIAVTPNIKLEAGVPTAMVLATYTDTAAPSSSDLGFTLGNLWLGGRYVRPIKLPSGPTIDVGAELAVFLPTAQDNARDEMTMSIAAGNASRLAESFERSHDTGRFAPDQTTIHVAGDARMRHGRLFGQLELGFDRASYTVMNVDGSALWFRASIGGGAVIGATKRAAFLAELTTFTDVLDDAPDGQGFRSAFDFGFQFRKAKQLMMLALYIPIDSFSRDHDYIGLQFTSHFGF